MITTTLSQPIISRFNDTNAKDVMDFHRTQTPRSLQLCIDTEFVSPTDTEGSQYKASMKFASQVSLVPAQYDLTTPENHLAAALQFIRDRYHSSYKFVGYESSDDGYQFFFELTSVGA